jgi:hypothetical protein
MTRISGVLLQYLGRGWVDMQLAETAAEVLLLVHPDGLIAKEDHKVLRQRLADLLETVDLALPSRDAKALSPGADVGRVHGAMRKPAGAAVIVPSPERGVLHLELHDPAQALTGDSRGLSKARGFYRLRASLEWLGLGCRSPTDKRGAVSLKSRSVLVRILAPRPLIFLRPVPSSCGSPMKFTRHVPT